MGYCSLITKSITKTYFVSVIGKKSKKQSKVLKNEITYGITKYQDEVKFGNK